MPATMLVLQRSMKAMAKTKPRTALSNSACSTCWVEDLREINLFTIKLKSCRHLPAALCLTAVAFGEGSFFLLDALRYFYANYFFLKTVLNEKQLSITIKRLSHQVLENHIDLDNTVLIGIQPRGIFVSDQV